MEWRDGRRSGCSGAGEGADTLGEVTELTGEGNVKQLRHTARVAAGPPRVLIFALDGVGRNALHLDFADLVLRLLDHNAPADRDNLSHAPRNQ